MSNETAASTFNAGFTDLALSWRVLNTSWDWKRDQIKVANQFVFFMIRHFTFLSMMPWCLLLCRLFISFRVFSMSLKSTHTKSCFFVCVSALVENKGCLITISKDLLLCNDSPTDVVSQPTQGRHLPLYLCLVTLYFTYLRKPVF